MPLEIAQTYDFDRVELAHPTPDNDFVPEPVTWLSLPPIAGEPEPNDIYIRVSPAAPDDSSIVLQGTSQFTITFVSAVNIVYTGVDYVTLVNTTALHEYAAFLTADPDQVEATVTALQSAFANVPMAEYQVVFDRVSGTIETIDAVWQKLPDGQIVTLEDLRTSPNRIELAIVRNAGKG